MGAQGAQCGIHGTRKLGVDQKRRIRFGKDGHGRIEILGRCWEKLVDPRVDEETFEAQDTVLQHSSELFGVTGDNSAPETHVDPELAMEGGDLLAQCLPAGRGGAAVERHVHQGGDPSSGSRLGGTFKALP